MAERNFKVGDQVRLLSGGPVMTVEKPNSLGSVHCQWFAGKKLEDGRFPPGSLEHVPEEERKK